MPFHVPLPDGIVPAGRADAKIAHGSASMGSDNQEPVNFAMLTINEIFYSIQGESTYAGRPCVFVRLTACDLRCSWCDTPYAFHEGQKTSLETCLPRSTHLAARSWR